MPNMMRMAHAQPDSHAAEATHPIDAALLAWAARRRQSLGHERRVACLAGRLFDLTADRHNLPTVDRQRLTWAAFLHDVGRCGGSADHAARGGRMIRSAASLPLADADAKLIARLTRHHNGPMPTLTDDRERQLLTLLRAADALDPRKAAAPQVLALRLGDRLHLRAEAAGEKSRRKFAKVGRKLTPLEHEFDLQVSLHVRNACPAVLRVA